MISVAPYFQLIHSLTVTKVEFLQSLTRGSSSYPDHILNASIEQALQELIQGMIGIADTDDG